METKIKWIEGEGHITATYKGSSNGPIVFKSIPNEGIDREQRVTVRTIDNRIIKTINIKQPGLREIFICLDGEFILQGNNTFNVLKEQVHGI